MLLPLFLMTSKNGVDLFFDTHQLGVMLTFDIDVKILLFDVKVLTPTAPTNQHENPFTPDAPVSLTAFSS